VIGELSFGHATLIQQALTILHAYLVAARIIFVRIYIWHHCSLNTTTKQTHLFGITECSALSFWLS
jgi:hypothetical protein